MLPARDMRCCLGNFLMRPLTVHVLVGSKRVTAVAASKPLKPVMARKRCSVALYAVLACVAAVISGTYKKYGMRNCLIVI